ncbi:hypothetical protein P7K49_016116 [Saguinus oedipus]|uniref:Uncharacterized protein n=1 Tax=Saguinus oedipus TaxID=9490 RepID=A0ABQ9VBL6_SAGOE|nr:hypothetical protein P7K49_016116 [Saguinus oedipus]
MWGLEALCRGLKIFRQSLKLTLTFVPAPLPTRVPGGPKLSASTDLGAHDLEGENKASLGAFQGSVRPFGSCSRGRRPNAPNLTPGTCGSTGSAVGGMGGPANPRLLRYWAARGNAAPHWSSPHSARLPHAHWSQAPDRVAAARSARRCVPTMAAPMQPIASWAPAGVPRGCRRSLRCRLRLRLPAPRRAGRHLRPVSLSAVVRACPVRFGARWLTANNGRRAAPPLPRRPRRGAARSPRVSAGEGGSFGLEARYLDDLAWPARTQAKRSEDISVRDPVALRTLAQSTDTGHWDPAGGRGKKVQGAPERESAAYG